MEPLTAAMIAGGANIVSGFLGRKSAKKQQQQHFIQLRDAANRAGFNPLTVLHATGGGNFGQYGQILSRSIIGEGIGAATNAYLNTSSQRAVFSHEMAMENFRNENFLKNQKMLQSISQPLTRQPTKLEKEFQEKVVEIFEGADSKANEGLGGRTGVRIQDYTSSLAGADFKMEIGNTVEGFVASVRGTHDLAMTPDGKKALVVKGEEPEEVFTNWLKAASIRRQIAAQEAKAVREFIKKTTPHILMGRHHENIYGPVAEDFAPIVLFNKEFSAEDRGTYTVDELKEYRRILRGATSMDARRQKWETMMSRNLPKPKKLRTFINMSMKEWHN